MESWRDLAKQLWWEMTPQTNYHGTPHVFNEFDDSKFLTGEGFMAHGAGHYSADNIDVAKHYSKPNLYTTKFGRAIYDSDGPLIRPGSNKPYKHDSNLYPSRVMKDIDFKTRDPEGFSKYIDELKDSLRTTRTSRKMYKLRAPNPNQRRLAFLLQLDDYNVVRGPSHLYKVNVPNENFMINFEKPLDNHSNYIKSAIRNFYNSKDIPSSTKDIYKYLDFGDEYDTMNLYKWLAQDMANHQYVDPYNNTAGEIEASKMLNKYGVKGIRANGRRDGGINVTFSGNNIRMANTIPQQIRNRIPTQTLKKMARKLYNYPLVKGGVKFLDMFGPSLVIPDVMKLTHPNLYPYTNRDKQQMKQQLEKKYGIKINGNRITL